MKKGDIIAKEWITPQGTPIGYAFKSELDAETFIKQNRVNAKVEPDHLNVGKFMIVAKNTQVAESKGVVCWVEDGTVCYEDLDNPLGRSNFELADEEHGWKVIQESAPSYQSSVASMSEEELRASIESLRSQRASMPTGARVKAKKVSVPSMSAEDKLMLSKLAKIDPAKLAMLKEKLK